ncbi:MAG TPA: MerR family transcriptional regulator [Polyangiaceae bacterium]|nr:MerR family transcriptional regulator [Polyangiaceae bacterium]
MSSPPKRQAMKVSELSQKAGVPLPTIKFYIREKLLPPGESTAKNQASYGVQHLERLALIRALRDDAGLSIEDIGRALRAADSAKSDFVVAAIDALQHSPPVVVSERSAEFGEAQRLLLELCRQRGWQVEPSDISIRDAARALAIIRRSFPFSPDEYLDVYAEAAEHIAEHEIPAEWQPETADAALTYAMLGTVLFEPFILALRRAAHVSRSRKVRGDPSPRKAAKRPRKTAR